MLIASPARRHQKPLIIAGVILFAGVIMLQPTFPQLKPQLLLVALIGVVLIAAGFAIKLEPAISMSLSQTKLRYFHRYGQWSVPWQNIQRVFQPSFTYQLEQKEIPYIAIRLDDIEVIIERISPRLASRLIHEQRDIMVLACQQGDIAPEQVQINFAPYKTRSGYQLNGPIAGFLHQVTVLNKAYGAHLFIPTSCFTQSSSELIELLNQYKRSSVL